MSEFTQETIDLLTIDKLTLQATIYQNPTVQNKATLLYFHGGGFVFGEQDDLPEEYIEQLTKEGYPIVAFDYPLAPETRVPEIHHIIDQLLERFKNSSELTVPQDKVYLMGRSAGAYIALYHATYTSLNLQGVIAFYGYYNLNLLEFTQPSVDYLKYPIVNSKIINSLIKPHPVANLPISQRFPIYLYFRQTGRWMSELFPNPSDLDRYSISEEQLAQLPPTFLAAARKDADVPATQTRNLAKLIPNNELHLINSDQHDFDRTQLATHGRKVYAALVEWLNNNHNAQ
ncbi:alpha/beta hydrolase [Dolosicoccus paucivorans]|uniref:Alpha/beta hydrolase n=2 Tax=Dolosicoccus paucivorans TaxID=84521 RepID=A0A2N6SN46_9LACT|nr:alpha/beta hydrolase [Dolosicoccus paucivorans]PMB84261.1 alpha/beta hydrolase [Dolosicoccus paucivorans]PMC58493.1 alpha/beta hydrolase [Dolosicoccus paucivorans]